MSKRCRDDNEMDPPVWWSSTKGWVRWNGGTIDSRLLLTENRDIVVTEPVKKDQVLMTLPPACLVSQATVLSTENGKLLESIINDESLSFYNQRQDLLIAMSLASGENSFAYKPYLDTLPPSSDYDMLPRRWEDSNLQKLLTGSCLLDRVVTSREETRNDYEKIQTAWTKKSNAAAFPCLYSDFNDMLAAVTSRAFAGMGGTSDKDIAMVPLLDLCNHRRGNVTKNVSYVKTTEGSVQVTAAENLTAGTVLAITYGARGNAQLLLNYGFCIPDNMEPDGSSNDVLEFKAKEDMPPIDLRSGPKSYTFGCFVKVLEMFHETPGGRDANNSGLLDGSGGMDDMEAFLNECEEEGEEDWNYNDGEEDDMEDEEVAEEQSVKAELVALAAMQRAFERAKEKYILKGDELEQALVASGSSPQHYAAILVASELRTIYLYELGISFVLSKLKKEEPLDDISCSVNLTTEDEERLKMQAKELAQAFIGIRYPFL